jgi:glycosyltransferase involved in cell wall biosynthesis
MLRGVRIAVVIPAFHEAARVGGVIRTMPRWVDAIVVVDDASADETSKAAGEAASAWSTPERICEVVRHAANRGVGAAIVTGYRRALALEADVIAVMAGDGQMDPEDLEGVVTPVVELRADYVKGNRFLHAEKRRMPRGRRFAGKALATATRLATGFAIDDSQCGFTALSARAARDVPLHDLWPRYGYPNDLLGLLAASNCRVAEVPVRPIYAGEQSGIRFWHAAVVLGLVVRRWTRSRRGVRSRAPAPPA